MEQYVIHYTVEIAGHLVAQGNLADHMWSTLQACKDYIAGSDPYWLQAKEWLAQMAGPHATINYECISSHSQSL